MENAFREAMREGKKGITLDLKVTPGAKTDEFLGVQANRLRVKVSAKAVDGAANEALIKLLSKTLAVPTSCITLISGKTGRMKSVFIRAPFDEIAERISAVQGF